MIKQNKNETSRKIRPSRGKNLRGKVPSQKMGYAIYHESSIERDVIHLLEFSDQVKEYYYQPFPVIPYQFNNRDRRYHPDFKVVFKNGNIGFIEAKPFSELSKPEITAKIYGLKDFCDKNHYVCRIITDKDIRIGSVIDNIVFLKGYRNKSNQTDQFTPQILEIFKTRDQIKLCDILTLFNNEEANVKYCLYYLLYHKALSMDMRKYISMDSTIYAYKKEFNNGCYKF